MKNVTHKSLSFKNASNHIEEMKSGRNQLVWRSISSILAMKQEQKKYMQFFKKETVKLKVITQAAGLLARVPPTECTDTSQGLLAPFSSSAHKLYFNLFLPSSVLGWIILP